MSKIIKVRRKYNCLFEKDQELIYVKYEDLQGYIHYEYCDDPTQQEYKMTTVELMQYKTVIA
jgi:hypothetical protein